MTEGFARANASYGTTYVGRRASATDRARRRAGVLLLGPRGGVQLLAAGLIAALLVLACWPSPVEVGGRPVAAATAGTLRAITPSGSLRGLTPAARAAVSTALGADRPASAARATGFGYALAGGGVRADLARDHVRLSGTGGSASLTLRALGRGQTVHAVGTAPPTARANRVTYHHGNVSEWYAAGPLGVEQGFTIARRPSGDDGPLVLTTAIRGSLLIRRSGTGLVFTRQSGAVALRYSGLQAVDAAGRRLPAALALQHGRLLIRVSDRHARYPVTIDPFIQQGHKLTANDTTFPDRTVQGISVAMSQDGSTLLVGGTGEGVTGAAWVFANAGGVWSQQGGKLTPNNASPPPMGNSLFGTTVALSRDGSTALIGAPDDENGGANAGTPEFQAGAVWVFVRSGNTWSQHARLLPGDATINPGEGGSQFGASLALSGDGGTALIGGWADNHFAGAVWIFSTTGTQIGAKLAPPVDAGTTPAFGKAVAVSDDGSTALIAGTDRGEVWAYARSGNTFVQQSSRLTPRDGSNPTGGGSFGSALALSQNGNTALIGGSGDGNQNGAAWVFTRSGTTWSQPGPKLTPSDETNAPTPGRFGTSVALSADGNTALIGAPIDSDSEGAAWTFIRAGASWVQRDPKIAVNTVGNEVGLGQFGSAVALSGNGIRAAIGGPNDSSVFGAVWAFNQVPSCTDRAASTPPGGGTVSVTLSCVGPVAPVGQQFRYAIATGPTHGGTGSINQMTGAISYVSQPGFSGTDSFAYVASDSGGTSQPATVTITVPPAPPTCAATSATSPAGGAAVSVNLSCTGPAGVGVQYGVVSGPAHGTLSALNQAAGSVIYTPSPGFHGTDSFTYNASDTGGASAPATATIAVPPGPPVCADIGSSTAGQGRSITVQLSCLGPSGIALKYAIAARPAHGTLAKLNQARPSVLYTPRAGFNGHDHFSYTATDSGGTSKRATATITVPKPGGTLAFALLGWSFNPLSSSSQVGSLTATGVPVGTHIAASCAGHGCHLRFAPVEVTSTTTCHSKHHRCKRASRPDTRSIDLTPKLRSVHFPVGSNLTVTFTKRGFIGKAYVFTMRANRQPAWRAACLAPGSLVPGKGC